VLKFDEYLGPPTLPTCRRIVGRELLLTGPHLRGMCDPWDSAASSASSRIDN